jgi:hypothetical protein
LVGRTKLKDGLFETANAIETDNSGIAKEARRFTPCGLFR